MASLTISRGGRRVALVGAWTLAVLSLPADVAAEDIRIERPSFALAVPEPWVERPAMASDLLAGLTRQGDASAECLIMAKMESAPWTEAEKAEYEQFLVSEDGAVFLAEFMTPGQETVLEISRRRVGDNELVVVGSEKEGDRLTTAYFFYISVPGRLHRIRCETAAASYAALEAEFAAIIDALQVKP